MRPTPVVDPIINYGSIRPVDPERRLHAAIQELIRRQALTGVLGVTIIRILPCDGIHATPCDFDFICKVALTNQPTTNGQREEEFFVCSAIGVI